MESEQRIVRLECCAVCIFIFFLHFNDDNKHLNKPTLNDALKAFFAPSEYSDSISSPILLARDINFLLAQPIVACKSELFDHEKREKIN